MMKPVSERAATTWKPTKADLFISAGMALGFPLLAGDRSDKARRVAFRVIGLILFTAFVGLIHTMYWARFLHTVDPALTVGTLFVIATSLSGYSILPYLWIASGH
jgi:hypothetical protein